MIKAVNLSDGVDGLAGSLVLVAMIYLSVLAWSSGNILLLNEFSVIIGALFVFLLFVQTVLLVGGYARILKFHSFDMH